MGRRPPRLRAERLYPSGKKAFVISYRVDGRKRLLTLGDVGVLGLDVARQTARKRLVEVLDGKDPLQEREQRSRGESVKDLCDEFMAKHVNASTPKKPNGLKSKRDIKRRVEKTIVEAWGSRRATSITKADVEKMHERIGETAPYEANRVLSLVKKLFNFAERRNIVPPGHRNPAVGVEPIPEHARERWVTPAEMPRLAKAIDAEKNVYVRAVVWLYLLTGQRREELLSARRDDYDKHEKTLIIRDTKNGRQQLLPLSPAACSILDALPEVVGNPFLFPGRRKGRHLVNVSKPWHAIRLAAGVSDVTIHDLRRTVGSWLAQHGNTLHLIGRVLNHTSERTTRIYARFATTHVRQALDDHGVRLLAAAAEVKDDREAHEGAQRDNIQCGAVEGGDVVVAVHP